MSEAILLFLIIIPAVLGVLSLLIPMRTKNLRETISVLSAGYLVYLILNNLWGREILYNQPWLKIPGMEAQIDFQLRFYPFSQFIVLAIAAFVFLVVLYSVKFMADSPSNNQFYSYIFISEAMAFGAVLANNLVVMLFFWAALLITLYLFITLGNPGAYKTGIKALIISGLADLSLILGVGIVAVQAKTLDMTQIHLSTIGLNGAAFILMMVGGMAKAGAMPFHTWIPDAAIDAPLPFMALLPAAIEKLIGIYLVARIALDFFTMDVGMRVVVMTIGAVTIILAVMMALIQSNYKRLLSYHAISQVGYMILGIGTGIPVGIAGGLFHMINHAMYKSCLFLTGGSVEKQTGTSDLGKLGGLARQMPLTFACFVVAAASISGVPPFNGFVSKEMIFAGTLEGGPSYKIFFIAAVVGAIFTAASFLKLGHAVYFGKSTEETAKTKEVHWTMALPMIVLAVACITFGLWFQLPLNNLIKPALLESLKQGLGAVHFEFSLGALFWLTVVVLAIAVLNHIHGVKTSGRGLGASEHIHHLPVLAPIYNLAERGVFDPYVQGKRIGYYVAKSLYLIDRGVDWCFQSFFPGVAHLIASTRKIHNGHYANYLAWSLAGLLIIVACLVWVL